MMSIAPGLTSARGHWSLPVRTRSAGDAPVTHLGYKLARISFCLAAVVAHGSHAQQYEWVDQHGVVSRSDALPPDTGSFRELRVIEGNERMSSLERRTLEIINQEARASDPGTALQPPGELADLASHVPQHVVSIAETSAATENVRDPCLLSWDPHCHEKHAQDYDPRLGYAPSLLHGDREQAVAPLYLPAR
jgi:hypothetical protein